MEKYGFHRAIRATGSAGFILLDGLREPSRRFRIRRSRVNLILRGTVPTRGRPVPPATPRKYGGRGPAKVPSLYAFHEISEGLESGIGRGDELVSGAARADPMGFEPEDELFDIPAVLGRNSLSRRSRAFPEPGNGFGNAVGSQSSQPVNRTVRRRNSPTSAYDSAADRTYPKPVARAESPTIRTRALLRRGLGMSPGTEGGQLT